MPEEKKELKVTDKRIFTADGEIREEFRSEIRPSAPVAAAPPPKQEAKPEPPKAEAKQQREADAHGKSVHDRATSPETPFANFIEPLIAQAYMSLGMLRNPYQPQTKVDPAAARQMIDILTLLQEKTAGNLTPEEEDFLTTHLGELKLAYVQRTKSI
jgi:hypothetical protein